MLYFVKRKDTIVILLRKYFLIIYLIIAVLCIVSIISFSGNQMQSSPVISDYEQLVQQLGYMNLAEGVKYVGIEKCKQCHDDMYQAYMRTGMGQSWGLATPEKSASVFRPNAPLHESRYGFYYQPLWKDNLLLVSEFRLDNGDTSYKRIETVEYIVGSGQHTNSHINSVNGYLYQAPFTYYTQIGLLDFPPGFEGGRNSRFSRPIGFECISCHNSYPEEVKGSVNKYKKIPLGINCERCHGPGELHVNAMLAGETVNTDIRADFTIVNPKRLPKYLQFELCARCHNQGNSVLKEGKGFFDFKPGMTVNSIMDVFREVYENDNDAFWMETHSERLKKSKCFTETQNHPDFEPLGCLDCHFTSSMKHTSYKETSVDTFNNKCKSCHQVENSNYCMENENTRATKNNDCIFCHMPKTGVFDIPHVIISDHHIRVTDKWKQTVKSTNEIETGNFIRLKSMSSDQPDGLTMAKAYIFHFEKFSSNPALLDSAYFYLKQFSYAEQAETWVYYYYLKGEYTTIINIAEKYAGSGLGNAVFHYQVGQSYQNMRLTPKAIYYFIKAVKLEPFNLDYRNKLGTSLLQKGNYSDAKKEFLFVIKENPKIAMAHNNLGFIYLLEKEFYAAEKSLNTALRLDPDYINAHLNLMKLYLGKGQLARAKEYLSMLKLKYKNNAQLNEFDAMVKQYGL